jgi:hypothetical protein
MIKERRDRGRRAQVVWKVINSVVQNPSVTLTQETLREWLQVPEDAAARILQRLAASGLVQEIQRGIWVRATSPGVRLS